MASLADEIKTRVRYFLGYPLVESGAHVELDGFVLYVVAATNRLEYAMDHVRAGTDAVVLKILGYLDAIESKMTTGALCRLQASSVDEITMNSDELSELEQQYVKWAKKLADVLASVVYPTSYMAKALKSKHGNVQRTAM